MMKTYFVFVLFLVLGGFPTAGATPTGLLKGAEILFKGMGEPFVQEAFSELASVAVSFLRGLLNDGVFNSFGNNNDGTFKDVFDYLKNMSDQQNQVLTIIKSLPDKIAEKVIIADDKREILGCMNSYERLLQNPNSELYTDQVKKCEGIHTNVDSISRVLKEKSIFKDIKNEYKFCNGTAIVKVLQYLFNLLFEGYSIMLASHQLQGKNESQLYINEYQKTLEEINQAIGEELTDCAKNFCDGVPITIKQIPESDSENDILDKLRKIFPWYFFFIFKLKPGSKYALSDINSATGEFVNITEKADFVFIYGNLFYLKNDSIRGNLDFKSYNLNLNPEGLLCKHMKIGIKKDQLISHAGEKIYLIDRTADDISYFIMESRVLKCPSPSRGIDDCSSKPISYATSIHINTLQIAMTSFCFVIFIALLM